MSDYIKREDAISTVYKFLKQVNNISGRNNEKLAEVQVIAKNVIYTIPSADVAPVIRCEECKHLVVLNARDLYAHCKRHDIRFEPFEYDTRTNYCSWAERKDND